MIKRVAVAGKSEPITFGEELRVIRDEELGWTQTKLAGEVTRRNNVVITEDNLEEWENNRKLEEITPDILRVLCSVIHAGLQRSGGMGLEADHFRRYMALLLKNTREQLGHSDIEIDVSFGDIINGYRRLARLEHGDVIRAIPMEEITGRDIADIEQGQKPEDGFLAKLSKVPEMEVYRQRLHEAFSAQEQKGWRQQHSNRKKRAESSNSKLLALPEALLKAVADLNAQKREIAAYFLEEFDKREALTEAQGRQVYQALVKRSEASAFANSIRHLVSEVDPIALTHVRPAAAFSKQPPDVFKARRSMGSIGSDHFDRIVTACSDSNKHEALRSAVIEYNVLAKKSLKEFKAWRHALPQTLTL